MMYEQRLIRLCTSNHNASGRGGRNPGQATQAAAESTAAQYTQTTQDTSGRGKRKNQETEATQTTAHHSTQTTTAQSTQRAAPQSTQSTAARGRGRQSGRGRGSQRQTAGQVGATSAQYKRPRVTGIGLMVRENGFTTFSSGGGTSRTVDTGTRPLRSSAELTGDLGFQPPRGVKWRGRLAVTTQGLERLRGERIMQARKDVASTSANHPSQGSTTHSQPWKI